MQEIDNRHKSKSVLILQTRDELVKIDLKYVVYVEADGNYSKVVFMNGVSTMVLISMTKLEALFSNILPDKFIRVGKRHLICRHLVFSINIPNQQMILTDLVSPKIFTLSISKEALKEFKEKYTTKTDKTK